jgi:hypothetical protein
MRAKAARLIATTGAVLGWAALILQLILLIRLIQSQGGTLLEAVWRFVGYFTILTNIAAAAVLTYAAMRPDRRYGLSDPRVALSVTVALAMVGIVYSAVLRALWSPQGWQKIADVTLHDIAPVVFVFFFLFRGHGPLRWRDSAYAVVMPTAYVAYAFARGAANGWYAYDFLDPSKLGVVQVSLNIAGLTLAFLAVALVLIGLTRLTDGSRKGL